MSESEGATATAKAGRVAEIGGGDMGVGHPEEKRRLCWSKFTMTE